MKNWKRFLALMLGMVMLLGCLSACGGKTDPTTAAAPEGTTAAPGSDATEPATEEKEWFGEADGKTPITLEFWAGIQPEYGYADMVDNFNEEYKDKGLQVHFNKYQNNTDGNLQLETYLMGGADNGVDVFIGYGNKSKLVKRGTDGMLYDYSDYLKSIGFDVGDELGQNTEVEYVLEGGTIYGLPTKFDNNGYIMINVDMFKEAGIDVPYTGWTYDEFRTAVEKLTKGEGQSKVYGMCWGFDFSGSQYRTNISGVLGINNNFADDSMKTCNYDNEVWIEGIRLVKETIDKGWAPSMEEEKADQWTVDTTFLQEKCAIFCIFSQLRLAMDTETYPHDFTTALVPFPVPSEEYAEFKEWPQMNYSGDYISIASGCPHKEAACEFVRWYIQGGMTPLINAARYPLWLGTDMDSILQTVEAKAGSSIDMESIRHLFSIDRTGVLKASYVNDKTTQLTDILNEEITAYLYGNTATPEEAMKNAQTRGDALLAQE